MSETSTPQGLDGQFLVDYYRRQKRLGGGLILIALIALSIFFVYQAAQDVPELDYSKIGVHFLFDDGRNQWETSLWENHFVYAAQVRGNNAFALQVIRADDLDPTRWQVFLDLCAEYGFTPVLRLATTFNREAGYWNAPNPDENGAYQAWGENYAAFLNALTWHNESKHVILLNEPNNGHEWSGRPNVGEYTRFVQDVAPLLDEQVTGLVLLNAAFDLYAPHTGTAPFPDSTLYYVDANSFMDSMYALDPTIFSHFDLWNSHSYPLNLRESPYVQAYQFDALNDASLNLPAVPDGIYNRGINGYEWELWKLAQFDIPSRGVLLSETGWRHTETVHTESRDKGENYPDEATVRRYLDLAMKGQASLFAQSPVSWTAWLGDERLVGIVPFAFNGVPREWGHTNWLKLAENGQVEGVYSPFELLVDYFK